MLTVTALFTQSNGEPATGLTLADIALYLTSRAKTGGAVAAIWAGVPPTEEIGGGLYSKAYSADDATLYHYYGYAEYTGAEVLDSNYALYSGSYAPEIMDIIGSSSVTVVSPIADDGTITVMRGDDYLLLDARQLAFTGTGWPVITAGAVALIVRFSTVASYAGVITGAAACYVELTTAQTALMVPGIYDYDLQATLADASIVTLAQGDFVVLADVR